MKNLGMMVLALSLTLGAGVGSAKATNADAKTITVSASTEQLVSRLHEIKTIASHQKLTNDQKDQYKNEVLSIREQLQQRDPVLVISLGAALLIVLIIVLLAHR